MNSGRKVGFGIARVGKWGRGGVSTLLVAVLAASAGLCGCESTEDHSGALAKEVGERNLAAVSTTELKARRAEVLKQYGEIQRDVEFKAGLPMGGGD